MIQWKVGCRSRKQKQPINQNQPIAKSGIFRLRRFDFHLIVSLYPSDYDPDYDSVASENQPLQDRRTIVVIITEFLPLPF